MSVLVDTLYVNANVRTMDPDNPLADSFAVVGPHVIAVGRGLNVAARRVIDLRGATVLPGFNDAHQHMIWYGRTLVELDARPSALPDLAALYAAVGVRARETGADATRWVVGGGYDQTAFAGQHPQADELERVAPGVPVWLRHTSGHMGVASLALLELLGVTGEQVINGGRVQRRDDGSPTGLLEEGAMSVVQEALFPYAQDDMRAALSRASDAYAAEGITSVTECGIGGGWIGHAGDEVAAYQHLADAGHLHQRVTLMPVSDVLHPVASRTADLTHLLDLGVRTGFGDDRLRFGAMKIFTDGSLIGRTAAMCHEFADDAGNRGYLQANAAELERAIVNAHAAGWQVAAHAIGDRAIDVVLDAFETCASVARPGPPHRIEHCAVTTDAHVARIARLGVVPVPQGSLVREAGDGMLAALGPDRARGCYRVRSFLDRGVTVPASTDRPVVGGNPLQNVHALVTRRTASGALLAPEEAVTVDEALFAYTVGSAVAAGTAARVGALRRGLLADFNVLLDDPCGVDVEEVPDIPILATVVGGELVQGDEEMAGRP